MSGMNSTTPRRHGGTVVKHLRALLPRFFTTIVARYSLSYTQAFRSTTDCRKARGGVATQSVGHNVEPQAAFAWATG